jgi:hypothetical protein
MGRSFFWGVCDGGFWEDETAGTGARKTGVAVIRAAKRGMERYVHRGGLPTWAGKLLGTYFSVPVSPAAIERLVFCVICETNLGNGFVFENLKQTINWLG